MTYQRILMVKSHSMGVGDVLRSSAAWRVLKDKWPQAELHLLFLSKHAGYPTEDFIRQHHLLTSATFITIREGTPSDLDAKRVPLSKIKEQVTAWSHRIKPDLVIDFEASGIRSSLVTRWVANSVGAKSVGIAQFWGRGLFYDISAPSVKHYVLEQGLQLPMDYSERDFVVLAALGLHRNKTPIELQVTTDAIAYADKLKKRLVPGKRVIGLNIGCGTADAFPRRPPIDRVASALHAMTDEGGPFVCLLTGAPFEKSINQAFIDAYGTQTGTVEFMDCAGKTSLSELAGLISLCDVFISSDSGPYHMSVALKKPTIAWFMYDEPAAYHRYDWCRCLVTPSDGQFTQAVHELLEDKLLN
jgi:ADP-heptose:LPS heptosyltransferase